MPQQEFGLTAQTPVLDAARRVLSRRFEAVRDRLAEAIHAGGDRPAAIHALRVATRRAAAAVDVFDSCLPTRIGRRCRRHLRQLRKAAGGPRDWDVFLAAVARSEQDDASISRTGAGRLLTGYAVAGRIPADATLAKAFTGEPFAFERTMAETVAAIRDTGGPATLAEFARPLMLRRASLFDAACGVAVDPASGAGDGWEQLHQARIAGKRLRYAIEILRECLSARSCKPVLKALTRLQEILGTVNDDSTAIGHIRRLAGGLEAVGDPRLAEPLATLRAVADTRERAMAAGRDRFSDWLTGWRSPCLRQALQAICLPGGDLAGRPAGCPLPQGECGGGGCSERAA